jgi:translation initiation factor eIF-2B subunit beta
MAPSQPSHEPSLDGLIKSFNNQSLEASLEALIL